MRWEQTANDDLQTGVISKMVGRRCFGFISTTDSKPGGIFFHGSSLGAGIKFGDLREGQQVRFKTQLQPSTGKQQAVDVELVQEQELLTTRSGTVTMLVSTKRFGFIQPDDGSPSVFFHWTGVVDPDGFDGLREGMNVVYLLNTDMKNRLKAIVVTRE